MKTDQSATITQTITQRTEWVIAGGYFKLLAATIACDVELWNGGRRVLDARSSSQGFYQRTDFDKVVITPTSGTPAITFLAAGDEGGNDSLSGSVGISSPAIGVAHSPSAQVAGAASAQILAANASRRYLAIQNQSATEDAYVHTNGGPAAVNSTSTRIRPGETWEPPVAPTGAIFAIRGAAANVDLNVIEA
jgi:hypothetical protein